MFTSLNDLYLYDDVRRLLLNDDQTTCLDTDNAPMNKRNIKVHKGVDNILKFRVFNPDRQPVNICNYDMMARIFNTENRELVLQRPCRTNTAKGMLFLDLDEGDIANLAEGLYEIVIVGQQQFAPSTVGKYATTTPFYTDFDSNIVATIELTGQAERVPLPTYTIDEWTMTRLLWQGSGPLVDTYYSSSIPGARVQNHTWSTHSFSIHVNEADKFTGTLEVLGTLDINPYEDPNSGHWFKIQVVTGSDYLEFIDFFGTEAYTFSANIMFLKFVYTPSTEVENPGRINKILVRT